ncbi:MAG: hypothetical protein IPL97_11580 [Niastella sp.]|nr:hypothetical protein [Niastella sp.]
MKLAICAPSQIYEMFNTTSETECIRAHDATDLFLQEANAYFYLYSNIPENLPTDKIIFINAVCHTLKDLNAPRNIIRINGWNGFVEKENWELAGAMNDRIHEVLEAIGKKAIHTDDIAGFISPGIISLIINEAYFALEEKVSSKKEIDIAMKLGTNYPYGPFEWAEKIGLKNIYDLLKTLSKKDERFTVSSLIQKEANS